MTGYEFKLARKKARWTQEKAAQRLGVSQSYVALLERGRRAVTPRLASRVVRTLSVSPVSLPPIYKWKRQLTGEVLAKSLSSLGYPGFAYLHGGRKRNPGEVLLT